MAGSAPYVTLLDFLLHPFPRGPTCQYRNVRQLLATDVVEVEYNRVGFAAVNTRMGPQVFVDPRGVRLLEHPVVGPHVRPVLYPVRRIPFSNVSGAAFLAAGLMPVGALALSVELGEGFLEATPCTRLGAHDHGGDLSRSYDRVYSGGPAGSRTRLSRVRAGYIAVNVSSPNWRNRRVLPPLSPGRQPGVSLLDLGSTNWGDRPDLPRLRPPSQGGASTPSASATTEPRRTGAVDYALSTSWTRCQNSRSGGEPTCAPRRARWSSSLSTTGSGDQEPSRPEHEQWPP